MINVSGEASAIERASLIVIGAGTYGAVIAELARACGYRVTGFLDEDPAKFQTTYESIPVVGPVTIALQTMPKKSNIAVAVGNNAVRLGYVRLARELGHLTPPLLSPQSVVSESATISPAVYLHATTHVWTRAVLGMGTILSPHATVAHHSTLGDGCFVSTDAHVGASIQVGDRVFFGMGSTTSTGVNRVGTDTVVGAGAVIIHDTEPGGVYAGVPGRLLRYGLPR